MTENRVSKIIGPLNLWFEVEGNGVSLYVKLPRDKSEAEGKLTLEDLDEMIKIFKQLKKEVGRGV